MHVPRVLALVMAGGSGSRLDVLTDRRAKPAMPFGGVYRLIDFPLSNCLHSRIEDVWIIQQYQPQSLNDYVANGRPWDLDRTYGGLRILHPHLGDEEEGFHEGNADAIRRNARFIREHDPDVALVLSSDHVYKLDYRDVIRHHVDSGAEVTMVTTEVPKDEASRFGVVVADAGRIVDYQSKPDDPKSDVVTTEVFAFSTTALLDRLEEASDGDVEDLDDVLPGIVADGAAAEFRLDGYWRDLGTVDSYWAGHMDLLGTAPPLVLDDPGWLVHTLAPQRPAAHVEAQATCTDTLVSPGARVAGVVERSVLGPGVIVEEGATVRDAVVLHDARILRGATVEVAIIDADACVGRDATVGAAAKGAVQADAITIVGHGARIDDRARVVAGERVEPADTN